MITTIILKLSKYAIAFVVTMFLWNYAGQTISAKDNISIFVGMLLYFIIVSGWIWLIGNEFPGTKAQSKCDDENCGCSHDHKDNNTNL